MVVIVFAFWDDDDVLIRVFMSFCSITVLREDGGCSKAAAAVEVATVP